MKKLSKTERKEMTRKAMEQRAKQPKNGTGFAKLDADAERLNK